MPEWAAHVPEGWGSNWLKWSVDLSTKRPTEEEQEALPYISNEDIASWTGKLLVEEPKPAEADSRRFQKDDVLFNKLRPYLAKVFHATFDGVSSGELLCLRPSQTVEPRFLFYVLVSKGFIETINAETFGAKMPRADWEIVGHQPLPLPPLDTQRRIARFLDEKTARIDGLIEKKRALLDRLAEKRQALITRAVTKGLPAAAAAQAGPNPDAPLKPSGIDWLGDIPAHWLTIRLGYVSVIGNGSTPSRDNPEYWEAGTYPWLNSSVVNLESVQVASDFVTLQALEQCHLPIVTPPAVLIGITGQGKTRGMATILQAEATINQHIAYVKPTPSVLDTHFLRRVLNAAYAYLRSESDGAGSTKGAITCEQIKTLGVQRPPIREQREIVAFIEKNVGLLRDIETRVLGSIEALSEYRSAIITAAVTGQIHELR
nr:restriction endonuclease subunit S [Thiococcus pfennigii]